MTLFQAKEGSQKLARDLTANAVLMSTSKYVKGGPAPVGTYEADHDIPQPERPTGRRLKTRTQIPTKSQKPDNSVTGNQKQQMQSNVGEQVQQKQNIFGNLLQSLNTKSQAKDSKMVTEEPVVNVNKLTSGYMRINSNQTPQPSRTGVTPNTQKPLQIDLYNLSGKSQPTRYGANKRPTPRQNNQETNQEVPKLQKVDQVSQVQGPVSQRQKVPLKIQPTEQIQQQQPTPKSVNSVLVNSKLSQKSTPINKMNKKTINSPNQQQLSQNNQTNKIDEPTAQDNAQVQQHKPIARNTGRAQFKGRQAVQQESKEEQETVNSARTPVKDSKQVQEQNTPVAVVKKRSKIIVFLLKKIFHTKTLESFSKIKLFNRQKNQKYVKIFVQKLNLLSSKINRHVQKTFFAKLIPAPIQVPVSKNVKQVQNQPQHNLKQNVNKFLASTLHRLFAKKVSSAFSSIKPIKVSHSVFRNKLVDVLNRLFNRNLSQTFSKISKYTIIKTELKSRTLQRASTIGKQIVNQNLSTAFKRILSTRKTGATKQQTQPMLRQNSNRAPLANSQAKQVKSEKQNKLLIKYQKDYERNQKILLQLTAEHQSQISQQQQKQRNLLKINQQLSQQNQLKKSTQENLKQRISNLKMPEQQYIQDTELLSESRFPLLYQLFLRVQKWSLDEMRIQDFLHTYPYMQEQVRSDELVQKWAELDKNLWLKKQISKYEGVSEYQRKAARIANQQQQMLSQMVGGYVKQKYIWEWVKSALANLTPPF